MTRRLGILGGTFDPVHYGHLVIAQEAVWALDLERVLFLPARVPPHKRHEPVTSVEHRVAMVRLAIADNPRFDLSTLEIERRGPSYTAETLEEMAKRETDAELYFIVGMDALSELPMWREPAAILERATMVAFSRPGWRDADLEWVERLQPAARERVRVMSGPCVDVSSTDLRARVAEGRPIRYLTPDSVVAYIARERLYVGSTTQTPRHGDQMERQMNADGPKVAL